MQFRIKTILQAALVVLAGNALSLLADTTNFTTAGTYSWTCPAGVTSLQVECWGGGGAGGGAVRSSANAYGGGGGGGAYAKSTLTVSPGVSYSIVVGAGGPHTTATITSSGPAPSGSDSYFSNTIAALTLAKGGTGGQNRQGSGNGTGGAGATAASCFGSTTFSGGNGATASSNGGGGGSSAGTVANGNNGAVTAGGVALTGGGAGGTGGTSGVRAGGTGGTPGGGGGGGWSSGSQQSGGDGAVGKVSITFTQSYDHVNVETAADGSGTTVPSQSLGAGSSITMYAVGRAADNSYLGNAVATWSFTNVTGSVVSGDLVAAGDGKSAVFTGHSAGTAQILALAATGTSNPSGTITVLPYIQQNLVWTGSSSANWDLTTLNWTNLSGVSTNFNQTDVVRFDDTSAQTSVSLAAQMSQGGMTVDTASTYTFSGSGFVGGIGNLIKTGTGSLVLNTTNTYSGLTTISNGTVVLGNATALGTTNSGTVIKSGASLDLNGVTGTAEPVTMEGAGVGGNGAIVNSGASIANNSFNGVAVTMTGNTTLGGSGRFDFNGGTFSGNGYKLTKVGGNSVVFSGNGNTDLGDIEIQSGALTFVGNVNLGRSNSNLVINPSTTLDFFAVNNTNSPLVKNIFITNGTITTSSGTTWLNTPITFDTALTLGGAANTLVSNTITSGTGSLTKTGAGTVTLYAANSFSGGTANNGGIINVQNAGALGTGVVTITAPASSQATRIDLGNGVNFTNHVVTVGRNTGFNGVIYVPGANDVATNSGSITCNTGNNPSGAGGHLCGPAGPNGMLHVLGPIIQGSDTPAIRNGFVRVYGGGSGSGFIINQGNVSLGAANGVNPSASLTLAASAATVFDLNGFNQTLAGLTRGTTNLTIVTNNSAALSTLTLNIAADQTFGGLLAGKLALVKSGPNIYTLTNANTYTGNTTVNAGTLVIQQPTIATNSTVSVSNSAVLQLDFSVTNTVGALVIGGTNQAPGLYSATTSAPYLAGIGYLLIPSPIAGYSTNLIVSVSGSNLTVSWPTTHLGWLLDQQTNSLSVGLSTNWQEVIGSASVTSTNFPLNAASVQFFRMRKP